jgi:hypothetical protein
MQLVISLIEQSSHHRRAANIVNELSTNYECTDGGGFGPDHVGSDYNGRSLQLLLRRHPGRGGQRHG